MRYAIIIRFFGSSMNKFLLCLRSTHAIYILITALWPVVDIDSFMAVTGPKTDVWLVKTVGALLIPVAVAMLVYDITATAEIRPLIILAGGTALAFILIDVNYVLRGTISVVYLADAALELVFLFGWVYTGIPWRYIKRRASSTS